MIDIFKYEEDGTRWIKMSEKDFQEYTADVVLTSAESIAADILRKSKKPASKKQKSIF